MKSLVLFEHRVQVWPRSSGKMIQYNAEYSLLWRMWRSHLGSSLLGIFAITILNISLIVNNTSHESYLLHPRPLSTQFKHQCWHQCQFSISIFDVGFSSCKTCHTVSFGGVNCDFRVRNLINYLDIFAAKNAYWQKYWVPTKKLSTEYILHYIYISRHYGFL